MNKVLKILFLCSQNKKRSPTAEDCYSQFDNLEVRSAGLNKGAVYILEPEDILWADIIFVMERIHLQNFKKRYGKYVNGKRL